MTPRPTGSTVENNQAFRTLREKVEILYGDRGDRRKAAMREGDAEDLREFIARLRKGTADVQKDLAVAVETLTQLSTDLDTIGASLDETRTDLDQTKAGLEAAQGTLTALQSSLSSVQDAIAAAQSAIDTLDQSGAAVAQDLLTLKTATAAVTIPDMASDDVVAAPTAAEHNLLRADVVAMRDALTAMRAAVST